MHSTRLLRLSLILIAGLIVSGILACNPFGGEATKPTVVVSAPANLTELQVGAEVEVVWTATDTVGVTRVDLAVDGVLYSTEASTSPQGEASWTMTQTWVATAPGTHNLTVTAYNAAGLASDPWAVALTVVEGAATAGTGEPGAGFTPLITTTVPAAEDKEHSVALFAAPGVVQSHGRDETEYRDLAPGTVFLASGSYLKTLDGEAFVVFPDDSILKLAAQTEVQVGMYDNGTMIWQHSGRTLHVVNPREGALYEVATPFGIAVAQGTEYEVRVDYPSAGWVTVYWGEIGVVETQNIVDPATGAVIGTRDIYGLVPEGLLLMGPAGQVESIRLEPGDTVTFELDPATGQFRGDPNAPPPDDDLARRNRWIAYEIRQLQADYQAGLVTREEYLTELNDLLNEALGLTEPQPEEEPEEEQPVLHGGLWGGENEAGHVISFCLVYGEGAIPDIVTQVKWVLELDCETLDTGEEHSRWDIWDLGGSGLALLVDGSGNFGGAYAFPDDNLLYAGSRASLDGQLTSGAGTVILQGFSRTSVEACSAENVTIQVQFLNADCLGD